MVSRYGALQTCRAYFHKHAPDAVAKSARQRRSRPAEGWFLATFDHVPLLAGYHIKGVK